MNIFETFLKSNPTRININAKPNSPKNQIINFSNNVLKLEIHARPENGRANKEIEKFMKKTINTFYKNNNLQTRINTVKVISGMTSQKKVIKIEQQAI